jgi:hypothetical protein
MPKFNVTLVARRDEETGVVGLVIEGLRPTDGEVNSASEGLLIAHDLIEHVNGIERIGSIDDELEALGAIWYVRGQHSDLSRNGVGSAYSAEENIASDVTRMFRDHFYGAYVEYVGLRTKASDADEGLQEIMRHAERSYLSEFDDSERTEARAKWAEYAALCMHRMRTGYRKARAKWERYGRFAANNAFWEIAEAVEPHAKHCDEGQTFKLTYNSNAQGRDRAQCVEVYEEEAPAQG